MLATLSVSSACSVHDLYALSTLQSILGVIIYNTWNWLQCPQHIKVRRQCPQHIKVRHTAGWRCWHSVTFKSHTWESSASNRKSDQISRKETKTWFFIFYCSGVFFTEGFYRISSSLFLAITFSNWQWLTGDRCLRRCGQVCFAASARRDTRHWLSCREDTRSCERDHIRKGGGCCHGSGGRGHLHWLSKEVCWPSIVSLTSHAVLCRTSFSLVFASPLVLSPFIALWEGSI